MIEPEVLRRYGALEKKYDKGDLIFEEDARPLYYYQIVSGKVKMMNCSEDGKEFIQGYFMENDSFGEPPLFFDGTYPACAMADADTILFRLKKESYHLLLRENVDLLFAITKKFAIRLKQKSVMAVELAVHDPEHRIKTLLKEFVKTSVGGNAPKGESQIPFTRQQIADMTGLRVETVIRVIKNLEEKGFLEIRNRKVFV